jgi:hypothetical protein
MHNGNGNKVMGNKKSDDESSKSDDNGNEEGNGDSIKSDGNSDEEGNGNKRRG